MWSLSFNSITGIPFEDVDLWEEHGLPVASQQAYPCLSCHRPKGGITRPDATRLAFVEGVLRMLATALERLGRDAQAVEHYRDLLRLNPGDNQGVRYLYLPLLLRLGFDAEAARYIGTPVRGRIEPVSR